MPTETELDALRKTLIEYGLNPAKLEDFIKAYIKNLLMKQSFDPDFDDDLEVK